MHQCTATHLQMTGKLSILLSIVDTYVSRYLDIWTPDVCGGEVCLLLATEGHYSSLQPATGVRTPYGRTGVTPPWRYWPTSSPLYMSRIVDIHYKNHP